MRHSELTFDRLRELLTYDAKTGVFTWRVQRGRAKPGDTAGYVCRGYRWIRVDGVLYAAHRLAWLYVYGHWPRDDIDHKNGLRGENTIVNLRDVDGKTNTQNEKKARRNNKSSGLLGVSIHKPSGRFVAYIRIDGRKKNLGYFDKAEDAHAAYLAAKCEYHSGFIA